MKKLTFFLLATMFFTFANGNIIEKNESIPEIHEILISTTKTIDLSGNLKKEFIYFGTLKSYSK